MYFPPKNYSFSFLLIHNVYYFHTEKGFSQVKTALRFLGENYLKPVFFSCQLRGFRVKY